MKYLKRFDELNELNASTYRNAANGLRDKHSDRAQTLDDYANEIDKSNETINVDGEEVKLSDIEYYPDTRAFYYGRHVIDVYKLKGETHIKDRISARKFRKYVMGTDFKIEKTYDNQEEWRRNVREIMRGVSVNDLYTSN